jgi:hypothetical protein
MIECLVKDCFCPFQDSVVEQLLISHADVKPAMIVRGTVAATEPFGSFIQLADGLRALCPLQHMSDFQRTAPSAKFQVLSGFSRYFIFQLDSNIFETSTVGQRQLLVILHVLDCRKADTLELSALKFRVLTCDIQTRKITLTHKKTLVSVHGYVSLFGFVSIFCLESFFAIFCTV